MALMNYLCLIIYRIYHRQKSCQTDEYDSKLTKQINLVENIFEQVDKND